jgi:hypothetical protein
MPQDVLQIYDGRKEFWQWDTGQKLIVLDKTIDQVHFSNKNMKMAIIKEVYTNNNNELVCDIPDVMLSQQHSLIAYAYAMEGNVNKTLCMVKFAVSSRQIPEDYTYEEDDRFKDLVNKVDDLEDALKNGAAVKKFNTLVEAEEWAKEYKSSGTLLSVNVNSDWIVYIVNEDYSLERVGDTTQLIIDIEKLQRLVGDVSVEDQIRDAIFALDLDDTYEKKGAAEAVHNELVDESNRAKNEEAAITREIHKINDSITNLQDEVERNKTDASEALAEYKSSNDASIKAITDDYLKEIDKIELDNKIKSNSEAADNAQRTADEEKERAKGVEGSLDTRLKAVENKFGTGEGNVESQIAAAKQEAIDAAYDAASTVKNDLLNGAGEAYDTLKELGDLINENQNALDALEVIANSKADANHKHDDIYYTEKEIDDKLSKITEYVDDAIGNPAAVLYVEQSLTDEQKEQARINIGTEIATDDEILEMLVQVDVLPVVTDADGAILADENENILLW